MIRLLGFGHYMYMKINLLCCQTEGYHTAEPLLRAFFLRGTRGETLVLNKRNLVVVSGSTLIPEVCNTFNMFAWSSMLPPH